MIFHHNSSIFYDLSPCEVVSKAIFHRKDAKTRKTNLLIFNSLRLRVFAVKKEFQTFETA